MRFLICFHAFLTVHCRISGMLITSWFFSALQIILLGICTERNWSKMKYIIESLVLQSYSAMVCYVLLQFPFSYEWRIFFILYAWSCSKEWLQSTAETRRLYSRLKPIIMGYAILQFSVMVRVFCMAKFIWALDGSVPLKQTSGWL